MRHGLRVQGAFQRIHQCFPARITAGGFFLDRLEQHLLHRLRKLGVDLARGGRRHGDVLQGHAGGRGVIKGQRPHQHLVQHHPQRIQVRGRNGRIGAARLLRRGVVGRAKYFSQRALLGVKRQPEVGQHYSPILGYQHVLRLDIPVDDILGVRIIQGVGDRPPVADHFVGREQVAGPGRFGDDIRQVLPVDIFHGKEEHAIFIAGIIDLDDILVPPAGDGARLVQHALFIRLRPVGIGIDDLDGHGPVEQHILGIIYGGHATMPDQVLNAVISQLASDQWIRQVHAQASISSGRSRRVSRLARVIRCRSVTKLFRPSA